MILSRSRSAHAARPLHVGAGALLGLLAACGGPPLARGLVAC